VGDEFANCAGHTGFAEGQRGRAAQTPCGGDEAPFAGQQETRLHLDRDHPGHPGAVRGVGAARGMGHGDVEQGHRGAAMRDLEGVGELRPKRQGQHGAPRLDLHQLEAKQAREGNLDLEFHASGTWRGLSPRGRH
jgi:hypothetical protein